MYGGIFTIESSDALHGRHLRAPAYLPPQDARRWRMLRSARHLFEGRHRQFFLEEQRTQFEFPPMRAGELLLQPYITFNLLRLIALKTADLLFGMKSRLSAQTPQQNAQLDLLARRSMIHSRFHSAAVDCSWAGGGFLESIIWNGHAYLNPIAPDEIYPQGTVNPDGQYDSYIRYATTNIGTREAPVLLLLETTYAAGMISRRLWQISRAGEKTRELSLNQWPAFASAPPDPRQRTGIENSTITYLPNQLGDRSECSDFDGLISLQDAVNAKFTQVARVLAKHADPKLAAPETTADPKGNLPGGYDMFWFRTPDEIPRYITWSAELDAAMRDRDATIDALCTQAEMSQVLLGIKRGGAMPDAARKLRLEATNTLAKVGRKALLMESFIARAVETTQALEQAASFRDYPIDPVGVEMRDGLPTDPLDDAQIVSLYRASDSMSLEDAVDVRVEDPDARAAEVARIRAEAATTAAAATPHILFGEPSPPPPAPPAPAPAQDGSQNANLQEAA